MSVDALTAAGWRRTPSGRYTHPEFRAPGSDRCRVFTEGQALTFLAVDDTDEPAQPEHVEELTA